MTNASMSSPGLYLTISTDDNNQTVTECPDFTGYHGVPYEKNQTCCDYYNASSVVDTSAFNSWITAGDNAGPSPSVGAIYGCCGGCSVRASSVQIYYWPSNTGLVTCTSYTTFTDTIFAITESSTAANGAVTTTTVPASTMTITVPDPYYVDPAQGCGTNGTGNYSLVTTVIANYTMTSPTPYIRFTSVYRYNWCGKLPSGYDDYINPLTTGLKTLASVETVTVATGPFIGTFTNQIYSDVNFTQYEECTSDDTCHPIVKLDSENYGMGRFKGCDPIVNGYYDPPVALTKATGGLDGGPTPPPVGGYGGIGNTGGNQGGNQGGGGAQPGSGPEGPAQPVQTGGGGNSGSGTGKGSGNSGSGNGNGNSGGGNSNGNGGTSNGNGGNSNGNGGNSNGNGGNSNGNGGNSNGNGGNSNGNGGNSNGNGGNSNGNGGNSNGNGGNRGTNGGSGNGQGGSGSGNNGGGNGNGQAGGQSGNNNGNTGNGNGNSGSSQPNTNNNGGSSNPILAIGAILGASGNGNNHPAPPQNPPAGSNDLSNLNAGSNSGSGSGPPARNPLPPITIAGKAYTPNSNGQYTIGSQTLLPGGPTIMVAGTPVAIAPGAGAIVVGSNTQVLNPDPAKAVGGNPVATPPPGITIGPGVQPIQAITAANGDPGYIIDGKTLLPGGAPVVVSGTTLSLSAGAAGTAVVMNDGHGGVTSIPLPVAGSNAGALPPTVTIGSNTLTLNPHGSGYVLGSQTLMPGATIVVDGTTLSLSAGPTGTGIVAVSGGHTSTIPLAAGSLPTAIVAGTHTLTLNAQLGGYVVDGQTLIPGGPAVTVDGTVLSLPAGATGIVTVDDPSASGIGNLILMGLGDSTSSKSHTKTHSAKEGSTRDPAAASATRTAGVHAAPTKGDGGRTRMGGDGWFKGCIVGVGVVMGGILLL